MNKLKHIRNGVAALVLATALLTPALTGCGIFGGRSAQQIAYTTLANVGYTTDVALKSYLDLVARGKVKSDSLPEITRTYTDFQAVYNAALTAAQGNANALAPAHVVDASTTTINEIEKAKKL